MSDIHLHRDLYSEATSRRAREADTWVRDQQRRRSAGRRAARAGDTGLRVRFVSLIARAMGVAEQMGPAASRPRPPVHKHTH